MYNLLISLGIGAVAFGLAAVVTSSPVAGVIPAMLAAGIAYFLLMRRTGQQLQVITQEAMDVFQTKMPQARTPQAQAQLFEEGRDILKRGFALERWQFLIGSQLHAQLGSLSYMQKDFKTAREHLEKADTWLGRYTAWQPLAMLALIKYRDGEGAAAVEQMSKLTFAGSKDALFWALYAVTAHRAKDSEAALRAISEGTEKVPESKELQLLADQLRNKKRLSPEIFGEPWLQFFPDEAERIIRANPALYQKMMAAQGMQPPPAANQAGPPMNRAQRRAAKKSKDKQKDAGQPLNHPRY